MSLRTLFALSLLALPLCAQAPFPMPPSEKIPTDDAISRVLKTNVLTGSGAPFHAVLDITEAQHDPAYEGRIELFWQSAASYRLVLTSRDFDQTLIVSGDQVSETDRGNFYPNWLHTFVTALTDPMPRRNDYLGRNGSVGIGTNVNSCVRHEERPGGITDQVTWSEICFSGSEPHLNFVIDFTYNMEFHDFQRFARQQIARTYVTGEGDHARLTGRLTTLNYWQPDASLLAITSPTPPQDRLLTTLVSTAKEESMLESAPKDVVWPPMREGKTEGYMIVQAITDRSGQVRETSKHNSDNPGLESFGREVALKYKFKPLIVDGAPQQMAMPLVLHFTTTLTNPLPELDDKTSRKLISACSLPHEVADPASAGQQITIQIQLTADGHIMTLGASDKKFPSPCSTRNSAAATSTSTKSMASPLPTTPI